MSVSVSLSSTKIFEGKTLPSHIDFELRKLISSYLSMKGQNSKTLHAEMDEYVREQFKPLERLVEDGTLTKEELERSITSNRPSPDYLIKYKNGTPVCMRYTNTIAGYFGVSYTMSTYNPADDLLEELNLAGEV